MLTEIFLENLKDFCDTTTSHGFGWYSRFDSVLCKVAAVVIPAIGMLALGVVTIQEVVEHMASNEMLTRSIQIAEPSLVYPSIIFCHQKFFDMNQGLGRLLINV